MTSRHAPVLGPPPAMPGVPPSAPSAATLFTIGYEKRDLGAYVDLLTQARVGVLVDVRETPWSYKPGFSKAPLQRAIERAGIAYEHAAFAGNPKVLRAAAPTHAACLAAYGRHLDAHPGVIERLDALLASHAAAGRVACLTCFERHPGDCHRAILAARWEAVAPAHRVSAHLGPEGCPRLTTTAEVDGTLALSPALTTALAVAAERAVAARGIALGRAPSHGARMTAAGRRGAARLAGIGAGQIGLW